uniref:Uncharacterized protein n=1 Tax=Echeneis naucrates TaxID=173247 RepID=A0A665VX85_ECHNA
MDNWKVQLVLVTFFALLQIFQGLSCGVEEEGGLTRDWQEETLDAGLTHAIAALMKRSKALRFYGLMGKRSGHLINNVNIFLSRNKANTFVGLMGRSISSAGKHEDQTKIISKYQCSFIDIKNIKLLIHI